MKDSLSRFGAGRSILADMHGAIIAGNKTLQAADVLDLPVRIIETDGTELVVVQRTDLDLAKDERARLLAYADNRASELGLDWSPDIVLADMQAGLDLASMWGSEGDLDRLIRSASQEAPRTDVDAEPQEARADELAREWGVKPGQIWRLGDHRLACGDCTDPAVVQALMQGERAILFSTDPPYLVDYNGTNHPSAVGEPDKNKNWSADYQDWDDSSQGAELYHGFVRVAIDHAIAPNAAWYCWHASRRQAMLEAVWTEHGAFAHQQIIWVKDRPVLTRSWYLWQHEPCLFGWVRGHQPPRRSEDYPRTVWQFATVKPGTVTDHPTSKPCELFALPMLQHTLPGEVCYEPFVGSGSQIIAGEQAGRRVYACEINPGFCGVSIQRWADAVGRDPQLLSGDV